jgi:alcohol dehydrogenase
VEADAKALRAAAGGGAQMAFDMVGGAQDAYATLAALKSLRRGGRLVLMGSMGVPLPISYLEVMLNDLEILGQFMYPQDAFMRLVDLARAGLLDLKAIRTRSFPLDALADAMEAATTAGGLECVVVNPS